MNPADDALAKAIALAEAKRQLQAAAAEAQDLKRRGMTLCGSCGGECPEGSKACPRCHCNPEEAPF